jgi:MarR-like DNA-binding transcriptional regulator SgrR of sgrS sRNA
MSEALTKLLTCDASSLKVYLILEAAFRGAGDRKVKTYRRDLAAILHKTERTVRTSLVALIAKGLIVRTAQATYAVITR